MRFLTDRDLYAICPHSPRAQLELFVEPLNATFSEYSIITLARQAAFLAQYAHETQGFTRLEENLMYTSPEQLRAVHPHDFDKLDADDAWGYVRQPERIANRVYAFQNGNGDEASGDGWRYRGRGLPHLTGLENYAACMRDTGIPLVQNPDMAAQLPHAARIGGWYWDSRHLNELADRGEHQGITRLINGGLNGLADRLAHLERAQAALA